MSIPVSSGIGTGAAQVYSMDKTYDALKDVNQSIANAQEYQRRQEAIKAKDKAAQEQQKVQLNKDFRKEYAFDDYSKIHTPDIPLLREKVNGFLEKYGTKGYEVYSGGEAALQAQKDWSDIQTFAAEGMQRKSYLDERGKDMGGNPNDYSDDKRLTYNTLASTPAFDLTQYQGALNRDLNIPDPVEIARKNIKDVGSFLQPTRKIKNDDGTFSDESVKWVNPNDRLKIFKEINSTSPEYLEGHNHHVQVLMKENPKLTKEQADDMVWRQNENAWALSSLPQQTTDIEQTTNQDGSKDKDLDGRVTIDPNKNKVLSLGSPIKMTGEVVVNGKRQILGGNFNNFYVDKDGRLHATLTRVQKDTDGNESLVSEDVQLEKDLYGQVASKLKTKGKISDYINQMTPSAALGYTEQENIKDLTNVISQTSDPMKLITYNGRTFSDKEIEAAAKASGLTKNEYLIQLNSK